MQYTGCLPAGRQAGLAGHPPPALHRKASAEADGSAALQALAGGRQFELILA